MDGLGLLVKANDALAAVAGGGSLSDGELGELLVGLEREQARLVANRAQLMAAFETRRAFAGDGSKTAAAWLARHTRCAPAGRGRWRVRVGGCGTCR